MYPQRQELMHNSQDTETLTSLMKMSGRNAT